MLLFIDWAVSQSEKDTSRLLMLPWISHFAFASACKFVVDCQMLVENYA